MLWPPNAILLAALLLMPTRLWWWCLAAVLPAHIAISLPAGVPWVTLLGLYLTNASQALLGAALFNRYARRYGSEGAHTTTIIFVVCAVFTAPIALSFADVTIAILTQWTSNDYWQAWCLRFLSNAASAVIIVPPILTAVYAYRGWQKPSLQRLIEACSLVLCAAGLGLFVSLGSGVTLNRVLPLLVCGFLPLLLWAATRFGQLGASWALLALAAATMGSIVRWPDGFAGQNEILMLQSIFLLISIPVLYLGALHGDLRRYVRELDTTAERYNMATAAASIGVWDWNPRTDDFFVHPYLKKLLGYDEREITNSLREWMRHYHPDDRERVLQPAQTCARGETASFEVEHRMLHANGSTRWLLTRGAMVRGKEGAVRLVGTCVDVTERRRIEDELRSLHHELAHLTRVGMLGQLSGALAHEINQPLASILGNAQAAQRLIARDPPDLAEIREALKEIVDADKRAGNVIHRLRAMLQKGEAQFNPLDLNAIVREVLDLTHSDLITHQVAVVRRFASYLPLVRGDRVQLQQVLLNFILNASEAMRDTALERRVLTVTTAAADDQSVEICVVDTGRGICSDLQKRLFEPFITTKKDGLGLGLSICRSIVNAHGGRLWAENNAEGGASLPYFVTRTPPVARHPSDCHVFYWHELRHQTYGTRGLLWIGKQTL